MLQLQPFEETDFGTLITWIPGPELLMQFAGPAFSFPLNHKQLYDPLSDHKRHAYKLVRNKKMIGYAEIYQADQCAYLGRIIVGNKQNRGKGTGLQLVQLLLQKAFNLFDYKIAALNVFDWNTQAIRCYEKAGFTIEPGKLLERQVNEQCWIAVHMTLSRRKWEQLTVQYEF